MKESYTVIIEKRHCENAIFCDGTACPLYLAIKEQLPGFPIKRVSTHDLINRKYEVYNFDGFDSTAPGLLFGWHFHTMNRILKGEIKSYTLTFWREIPNEMQSKEPEVQVSDIAEAVKPKEIIRYVSVPESVKEQTKELVLN